MSRMKVLCSDCRKLRKTSRSALRSATFTAFVVFLLAPRCQAQAVSPEAEADRPTAPVVLDGSVLFRVRGVSALPAEQRAQAVAERIRDAAADSSVSPETIHVAESEGQSTVMAGDRRLIVITDADAGLEGVARPTLAQAIRERLAQAVEIYRQDRSPSVLLRALLHSLGATLVLALVLFVVIRACRRLQAAAERVFESKIQASRSRSLHVFSFDRLGASMSAALGAARTLAVLVVVFLYANFVLGLFPWTRQLEQNLLGIFIDPLRTIGFGILQSVPNIAFIVILAILVRYTLRLLRLFFEAIAHQTISFVNFDQDWAMPTYRIVRVLFVAFALVVAYPYLPGSQSEAFKGISLFIGVILSLGSSSAIANVIAGYSLTYRRAFKLGDRVKIGEAFGDVADIRLQVTHVRSIKNEEIIIPNSEILNSQVINYSSIARQYGLILHTTVGIGYETPWRQVEAMLLQAADRTPELQTEPPPFVRQKALGDFAVTYELNVYCDQPKEAARLYTTLHRSILDVFNEYSVQIMTPAYKGDPAEPKLVPKEKWFEAPAMPPNSPATGGRSRPHRDPLSRSERS
jgi:small-conductance mechanosensitive channel